MTYQTGRPPRQPAGGDAENRNSVSQGTGRHGVLFSALTFTLLGTLLLLGMLFDEQFNIAHFFVVPYVLFIIAAYTYYFFGMPTFWVLQKVGWNSARSFICIGLIVGFFVPQIIDAMSDPIDGPVGSHGPNFLLLRMSILSAGIGAFGGFIFWFFVVRPPLEEPTRDTSAAPHCENGHALTTNSPPPCPPTVLHAGDRDITTRSLLWKVIRRLVLGLILLIPFVAWVDADHDIERFCRAAKPGLTIPELARLADQNDIELPYWFSLDAEPKESLLAYTPRNMARVTCRIHIKDSVVVNARLIPDDLVAAGD